MDDNPYQSPQLPEDNPYHAPNQGGQPEPTDRIALAVISFAMGFLSLLTCCLPIVGIPFSILGLVLGIFGRASSIQALAIAGIVLNTFGLFFSLLNAAMGAWMFMNGGGFHFTLPKRR